jgi:tRNA(His) 5'-end guanylyltransferase
MSDSLGDRMKQQYEDRTRYMLQRRTYTILRCDGKAFHTLTRHAEKPYDPQIVASMDNAALMLCEDAQGACVGYVQSDEISVLLQDFGDIKTDAWFDGNVQKIASVAASIATAAFNSGYGSHAHFDCRVFTIPDPVEVENYFIWRQQDAVRNSIQSLAQAHFSHKELHGLNCNALQEKLFQERGINWNDRPVEEKRGRGIVKEERGWNIDRNIPTFTQERDYLRARIPRIWQLDPASVSGTREEK